MQFRRVDVDLETPLFEKLSQAAQTVLKIDSNWKHSPRSLCKQIIYDALDDEDFLENLIKGLEREEKRQALSRRVRRNELLKKGS